MKRLFLVACLMSLCISTAFSQMKTASFKIGLPYSTLQFLLGTQTIAQKQLTPTLGLSYFGASSKSEGVDEGSTYSNEASLRLFIPRLGARIAGTQTGDLRTYITLEGFLVVPLISGTDYSKKDKEEIKDELDILGLGIGWGVEYYFAEEFSLGGEAVLNTIFHNSQYESDSEYPDYTRESSTTLGASLVQITLNYHF